MVDKYSARANPSHRFPRNAPRHSVQFVATVSDGVLGERAVEVRDLSRLGCGLALEGKLPAGTMMKLSLPALAPVPVRVVWSDGEASGVQFVSPLDLRELNMIADGSRRNVDTIRRGCTSHTTTMDALNAESLRAAIAWSLELATSAEQILIAARLAEALDLAERSARRTSN